MPSKQHDNDFVDVELANKQDAETTHAAHPWHAMDVDEVYARLGGLGPNLRKEGLTSSEADTRLKKYGFNQLSEKKKVTLLERIWHHINNVLVAILVVVAAVSAVRAATDDLVTNSIQVGIIIGVIA